MLAAKKQQLEASYPPRLVLLFDKVDRCEAAIAQSPDGFNLVRRTKDGTITVDGWMVENERIGAGDLASGALTECGVIITRRAFSCCGSKPYDQRPTYAADLDLDKHATAVCQP